MLDDFSQHEANDRGSIVDRIEWFMDSALRTAALAVMPWRWFRRSAEQAYYRRPRSRQRAALSDNLHVKSESFAERVARIFDGLEFFFSSAFGLLTRRRSAKSDSEFNNSEEY